MQTPQLDRKLDLDHARAAIEPIAADRRSRGATIPASQLEAAAALLVDLWQAAARHAITADHRAWTTYLPGSPSTPSPAPPARGAPADGPPVPNPTRRLPP